jgi:hypothetical protein
MAGLVPAIHAFLSNQRGIQVIPFSIEAMDQPNFPSSWPMFDGFFSLNREADIVVLFVIDEPFETVRFRKSLYGTFAMFEDAADEVVGDADVKDAVALIGKDVNTAAAHGLIEARRGWPGQARP